MRAIPAVAIKAARANARPGCALPLPLTIHDRARQASRPFRVDERRQARSVSLRVAASRDLVGAVEEASDLSGRVANLTGCSVGDGLSVVHKWRRVGYVHNERGVCAVAAEKGWVGGQILIDERSGRRWDGREGVSAKQNN